MDKRGIGGTLFKAAFEIVSTALIVPVFGLCLLYSCVVACWEASRRKIEDLIT